MPYPVPDCAAGTDQESIVEYLCNDADPDQRRRFEAHLEGCDACARELLLWMVLREALSDWTPPEPTLDFIDASVSPGPLEPTTGLRTLGPPTSAACWLDFAPAIVFLYARGAGVPANAGQATAWYR